MKKKIGKIFTLGLLLLTGNSLFAQDGKTVSDGRDYTRGWYVGAQAGMPMAESTFSSFGADKFRPGWNAGAHGGYRFNRVWSVEATANWGWLFLAEQSCCYDRGYFLGTDWNRYRYDIPEGMDGHYFKDLKSCVFVQRYGMQLNVNLLGFFNATRDSRWRLDVSPAVYGVGTSSDVMTKADGAMVRENIDNWHLGYGGNAQVSYALNRNLSLGVYGGFTHLTGKPMDGFNKIHSTNYLIDTGVKLSWRFGKKSRKAAVGEITPLTGVAAVAATATAAAEQPKTEEAVVVAEETAAVADTTAATENPPSPSSLSSSDFPVIYFSFNSIWIEPGERGKVKEIADRMKADKSIRVRVTGWGDETGGEEANKRVSLQRAEAVKRVLGQWLIPADRVETVGGGINREAASDAEARNVTTIVVVKE